MDSDRFDLEAGRDLKLGEFADDPTLNLSEARIILEKSLEARNKRAREKNPNSDRPAWKDTETLSKTRDYLEIFAYFKEMADAETAERLINQFSGGMERFEKSQLGSLVPGSADEARALIPSLEKKVDDGLVDAEDLENLCRELDKIKRQTQLL
ncbi:RNA polymerase B [Lithohypha guttulata]|uniref:RNA polymerase B n=1 Tax=Lithohypha guttulata TaxID=1690604 RepID=A0AAN7T2Q5_9EURO|nr:RNA polymerase B [Lithohypha guttulata]KAK5088511.1 RNA polymerase B [Lithohypha guttulata]KAK5106959.1 RNA polymerase B [Lithohypha guttulata]